MTINKEQKTKLIAEYVEALKSTKSVVIVQQSWVGVNSTSQMRISLSEVWWQYRVVRKRLLLRAVKEAKLQDIWIEDLDGSVAILLFDDEEWKSLKVVNSLAKGFIKDKESKASFVFLWWWFDWDWKAGDFVTELANVPSKDELLSKLVYLLNYPVQSFAATLKQIAEKKEEDKKEDKVEAIADVEKPE